KALPMNTPPASRDEVIFAAALDLPEAERHAYLDDACGGNDALRGYIERLLAAHKEVEFMPAAVGPLGGIPRPPPVEIPSEEAGDRIGNFRLIERLGEGGFGTVWLAEQEQPVKRQVALKIIKA